MKYKLDENGTLLCASEVCTADSCPNYESCVEATGWFVAPVGIGDVFYAIRAVAHNNGRVDRQIREHKVESIVFEKDSYLIDCGVPFGGCSSWHLGKAWFLTREEAEAALAEREVKNND